MKIIHIMSDGTVRDSVEGLVIPESVQEAYRILAACRLPGEKETEKPEPERAGCA